jgi:hypothetical protein
MRRVDPLGGQYGPLLIEREIGVTHHIDGMGERRLYATTCPDQTQMIPSVFLLDAQSLCPLYPRKRTYGATRDVRFGPKADIHTCRWVVR